MNPEPPPPLPAKTQEPAVPKKEAGVTKPGDLGLTERRRSIRPLPAPDAVESDGDTDWAAFQSLISDKTKT